MLPLWDLESLMARELLMQPRLVPLYGAGVFLDISQNAKKIFSAELLLRQDLSFLLNIISCIHKKRWKDPQNCQAGCKVFI